MVYSDSLNLFVYYLNGIRARYGRGSVDLSYSMSEDCQRHNTWMANGGGLNHNGLGLPCGENIAWLGWKPDTDKAVGELLRIWMCDEDHRSILLAGGRFIGLALYYTNDGVFGTFRVF